MVFKLFGLLLKCFQEASPRAQVSHTSRMDCSEVETNFGSFPLQNIFHMVSTWRNRMVKSRYEKVVSQMEILGARPESTGLASAFWCSEIPYTNSREDIGRIKRIMSPWALQSEST